MKEAFSPEGFVCDTSLHVGEAVEHTTSWLTINPTIGCPLGCVYCFRTRWGAQDIPRTMAEPAQLVNALVSHPEFRPNITPVAINVSSTDAFLPSVRDTTLACVDNLEARGLRNIVGLITKSEILPQHIQRLTALRYVRPIVFVSYALIPHHIEPVPLEPRVRTMRRLKTAGVPVVLYYRPIVRGWNDSPETMEAILRMGGAMADAIAYGGLRLSPEIRHEMTKHKVEIPRESTDFQDKELDTDIQHRLHKMHEQLGISIPLYKHTSCAVSFLFKMTNYNGLAANPERNCTPSCPRAQQQLCGRI
jgi:DNA repair photolyase